MIKNLVICDCCEKPIPTHIEVDEVYGEVECLELARTKEWDTRLIFPHLCEKCATKIDYVLLKEKEDAIKKGEISVRNAKLNAERREKLGSKG